MVPIEGNKVCDSKLPDHSQFFDYMSTIECYNLCDKKRCKAATITGSVDNPYCQVFPKCDHVVDADERSLTFTIYNPQVPYSPPQFRLCPKKSKDEEREGNDAKAADQGNNEKKPPGEKKPAVDKSAPNSGKSGDRKKSSGEGKSGDNTDESAKKTSEENAKPPADQRSADETKSDENRKPASTQIENSNRAEKNSAERNADSRQTSNNREEQAAGDERREIQAPLQGGRRYARTPVPKPTEKTGNDQVDMMQALHTPITGRNFSRVGISITNGQNKTKSFAVRDREPLPSFSFMRVTNRSCVYDTFLPSVSQTDRVLMMQ